MLVTLFQSHINKHLCTLLKYFFTQTRFKQLYYFTYKLYSKTTEFLIQFLGKFQFYEFPKASKQLPENLLFNPSPRVRLLFNRRFSSGTSPKITNLKVCHYVAQLKITISIKCVVGVVMFQLSKSMRELAYLLWTLRILNAQTLYGSMPQ